MYAHVAAPPRIARLHVQRSRDGAAVVVDDGAGAAFVVGGIGDKGWVSGGGVSQEGEREEDDGESELHDGVIDERVL